MLLLSKESMPPKKYTLEDRNSIFVTCFNINEFNTYFFTGPNANNNRNSFITSLVNKLNADINNQYIFQNNFISLKYNNEKNYIVIDVKTPDPNNNNILMDFFHITFHLEEINTQNLTEKARVKGAIHSKSNLNFKT